MLVALSTDDGENLTRNHFGDGKFFFIYEINRGGARLVKKVPNTSPEEKMHGDPNKASAIGQLLAGEGVQVLVAYAMGPNITRMRKKFVPVISRCLEIDKVLVELVTHLAQLESEASKKEYKEVVFICQ